MLQAITEFQARIDEEHDLGLRQLAEQLSNAELAVLLKEIIVELVGDDSCYDARWAAMNEAARRLAPDETLKAL